MTNGVSGYNPAMINGYRTAINVGSLHQNDLKNVINYAQGKPLQAYEEPGVMESVKGTLPFMGVIGGFQAVGALKNNGLTGTELEIFKTAKKSGLAKGWNFSETIQNVKARNPYTRGDILKVGQEGFLKNFKDITKKSVTVSAERGFLGRMLDKLPGYKSLRGSGIGQVMSNNKTGAGWMLVMDGAMEAFTQVVPAFKDGGFASGMKQIGKSAAKVAAGAVGWVAGDAVGRGLGAAIGTAICPGVGTVIGGFIGGFLGGITGSAIAAKGARAVTGKNEVEINQEKQSAEIAQQLEANPESKIALAQQTLQQAEQVLAQDPQNADALAAKASAENIIAQGAQGAKSGQTAQTETQQTQPAKTAQQGAQNGYNQSFKGSLGFDIPTVPGFNGYNYDMNQFRTAMSTATMPAVNQQQQQNLFTVPQTIVQPVQQTQVQEQQTVQPK